MPEMKRWRDFGLQELFFPLSSSQTHIHFLSFSLSLSLSLSRTHTHTHTHTLVGPEINCSTKARVKENDRLPRCSAMGNPPPEVIWFKGHQVDPLSPLS